MSHFRNTVYIPNEGIRVITNPENRLIVGNTIVQYGISYYKIRIICNIIKHWLTQNMDINELL